MKYVIDIGPIPALPVVGSSDLFPVARICCVAQNYAKQGRAMEPDAPDRGPPFFFMKPANSLVPNGAVVPYPQATNALYHEIELTVALGKGGANIPAGTALDHVWGYGVGLDMARRDILGEARKMGQPWEMGKSFDNSAACTALLPAATIGHPMKGAIWLKVNGVIKQKGDLTEMIWSVPQIIAYLSGLITLQPGDLIYSGTPAGAGPVQRGDKLEGHVDGVGDLTVTYAK